MTSYFTINVEAAIIKDNKWLLCTRSKKEKHAGGVLSLIGGTVEHSDPKQDTLESALIREIYEEIGVKISVINFVHNTHFVTKGGNHTIDLVFLCEIVEGEPSPINPDEIESLHWMSTDEIKTNTNSPSWLLTSIERASDIKKS
jgi:NADH pyrophosphatase NudC (nudix superfamily)